MVNGLTAEDGTRLHLHEWRAADPRLTVAVVHGYAEHAGRYAHVAQALNAHGISVVAVDLRGHGRSETNHEWLWSRIARRVGDSRPGNRITDFDRSTLKHQTDGAAAESKGAESQDRAGACHRLAMTVKKRGHTLARRAKQSSEAISQRRHPAWGSIAEPTHKRTQYPGHRAGAGRHCPPQYAKRPEEPSPDTCGDRNQSIQHRSQRGQKGADRREPARQRRASRGGSMPLPFEPIPRTRQKLHEALPLGSHKAGQAAREVHHPVPERDHHSGRGCSQAAQFL